MNFFLSKPIKRPALKQVLATYCPPIPEVEEDDAPAKSSDVATKVTKATTQAESPKTGAAVMPDAQSTTSPPSSPPR